VNNFSDIIYLDPNQIHISRENRQRKEIDTTDILESIKIYGIINPIIIKKRMPGVNAYHLDSVELVAGERRLEACKQLKIQAPCRLLSSLSPLEAKIIEFEENHKRKNLPWRDEVFAIGNIYDEAIKQTPLLTREQLALSLSLSEQKLNQILHVYENINEKIISFAENLTQAISLLQRFKTQKSSELTKNIKQILTSKTLPDYLKPTPPKLNLKFDDNSTASLGRAFPGESRAEQVALNSKLLNLNFTNWIQTYQGRKFNFIHCDFPLSDDNFWPIFNCFIGNLDKLLDNSAHILFWFNMFRYEDIVKSFGRDSLTLIPQPLIWYKSDTKPNQIQNEPPKSTYETCLILIHNNRSFKKQIQNAYHTPRASQPICPNQKSLPMLKYFFQTFIDEETNFFDPSFGSGSSIIAAEELKAKSILGLEINPSRFQKAETKILRQREINQIVREK
jgi:ParB family chromosome partitioning protein